ncbi:MAG: hypothetical protein PHQ25_00415 [Acidobacteriota bacterium]|nr:hypothetical protein [Acidobacteriota bacterium]MDW3228393.1 hypothetical protein [Acidobacteriota bacterium]MDY0231215.1 hypothetical protein [Candidatus Saccharicenans sp.]
MSKFLRFLVAMLTVFSTFLIGFHLGKEKEKARIPKFQEDSDRGF